jgi:hypothetical protein
MDKVKLRVPGGFRISRQLVRSIVTNPVYLGWWVVDGQVVQMDNHPAIIDEEMFLLAQEVLAQHGRGREGGIRLTAQGPQLLTGLLQCGRHDVPRRMSSSVNTAFGRYLCDQDYGNARADRLCANIDARLLDEPIADVVLRLCNFANCTEAVLVQIEAEYNTARDEARRQKRLLAQIQQEIDTLTQHLAITRTPTQAAIILEQIDQRIQRKAELADERNSPVGRVLTAAQVATVRAFIADLHRGWEKHPLEVRNAFLRMILERVVIDADRDMIKATVIWRIGIRQELWIERPPIRRGGKGRWTDEEQAWLRAHYAAASVEALQARFPPRSYTAIRKQAAVLGLQRSQQGVPKPRGQAWSTTENEVLRAYATGKISYADLRAQMAGRTWAAIETQACVMRLSLRRSQVFYRVLSDTQEVIFSAPPSQKPITSPAKPST